ncbi:Lutropin-choriogonadotropic hormone receptor, partial [Gryllus bimaculatus]
MVAAQSIAAPRRAVVAQIHPNTICSLCNMNTDENLKHVLCEELDDNSLTQLPMALTYLPMLQELSVSGNRLGYVPAGVLQRCPALTRLELKGNPVKGVHPLAFSGLPALRKLFLSDSRELKQFPALNGTSALEELYLDRSSLAAVPASLCRTCPVLRSLY